MKEPLADEVVEAHLPPDPHARWFLRRFGAALLSTYRTTYRTMDPLVAQVIGAPGVLPVAPADTDR